jgi:hypothetical protein
MLYDLLSNSVSCKYSPVGIAMFVMSTVSLPLIGFHTEGTAIDREHEFILLCTYKQR